MSDEREPRGTAMLTHVVPLETGLLLPQLLDKRNFPQRADLAQLQMCKGGVVKEIDGRHAVRQYVQHADGDQLAVHCSADVSRLPATAPHGTHSDTRGAEGPGSSRWPAPAIQTGVSCSPDTTRFRRLA
jgi:hypothetical protein